MADTHPIGDRAIVLRPNPPMNKDAPALIFDLSVSMRVLSAAKDMARTLYTQMHPHSFRE
jgi:hypothetical protein